MPTNNQNTSIAMHGTMVSILGNGLLLTGEPGIGKSELALNLLDRGHQLISDDRIDLSKKPNNDNNCDNSYKPQILATAPTSSFQFLCIRGIGVINIAKLYYAQACIRQVSLNYIIHLTKALNPPSPSDQQDLLNPNFQIQTLLGVAIPMLTLVVNARQNLALLVETLVKNEVLKKQRYNATQELLHSIEVGQPND